MRGRRKGERLHEGIDGLFGDAVHEVDAYVVKTGAARIVERSLGIGDGVRPAESLQLAGDGTLHSYAQAVDAETAQTAEIFEIYGRGVRFH